jgi:hypothetical protein
MDPRSIGHCTYGRYELGWQGVWGEGRMDENAEASYTVDMQQQTIDNKPERARRRPFAVLAAGLFLIAALPSLAVADSPSSPFPGLELVASKNVGALYRRSDLDLAAYSKITVRMPGIEFSKSWNPRNYGKLGISAAQLTKIRTELAAMAQSTFAKVLGDGGYEVVADGGDGVLEITPNVVNLFINAPDVPTAGRSKTYTMNAGSATLALQVNDAVTGTLLAVVFDQRQTQSTTMQWTTSVSNRAAADAVLRAWAEQFKRELDTARAK